MSSVHEVINFQADTVPNSQWLHETRFKTTPISRTNVAFRFDFTRFMHVLLRCMWEILIRKNLVSLKNNIKKNKNYYLIYDINNVGYSLCSIMAPQYRQFSFP